MTTTRVRNADRMMTSARLTDAGIEMTFADGQAGLVPFAAVSDVDPAAVADIELPNPYILVLHIAESEAVELPWDFVRSYCDESYRPRMEAAAQEMQRALGARVRRQRESAGMTQEQLANAAGIGRVTLTRIETGEQSPRYATLVAIAQALGQPTAALLVGE